MIPRRVPAAGAMAAQALFSLAQMTVTISGGIALEPAEWGRMAILITLFGLASAFIRGFGSQPIITFLAGASSVRDTRRAGICVSLVASIPAQVLLISVGVVLSMSQTGALLALALMTYSAYDVARSVELAGDRRRRLLVSDAVLFGVLAAFSAGCLYAGARATLGIPIGMATSYLVALICIAARPQPTRPWPIGRFLRTFWKDMPFFAVDALVLGMSIGAVVFVLGAFGSLSDAGGLRTALTLVAGPLQMALVGASPIVIRALRDRASQGEASDVARSYRFPLILASFGLIAGPAWGTIATVIGAQIEIMVGEPMNGLTRFAIASATLVSAAWACSVLSMYQRYRRPGFELSLVRISSVGMTTGGLLVGLPFFDDSVIAVLVAVPLGMVAPVLHLFLARRISPRLGRNE